MKLFEIYRPLTEATVGREFQHLEDLVFAEGSAGAQRAVEYLEGLLQGDAQVSIKWDGNPTAYFGRNELGEFTFVGKNAWSKSQYFADKQSMGEFIRTSGKGEDWRVEFAENMMQMWDIFESATPEDFRGYLFCDLLFYPGNPVEMVDGRLTFTPNKVTYSVDPSSEIGEKISAADAGAAAHKQYSEYGSKQGTPIDSLDQFSDSGLFLVAQQYVPSTVEMDSSQLDNIKSVIQQHGTEVDQFLSSVPGLKNIANIIYTFVNSSSKAGKLTDLEDGFVQWIEHSGKVSEGQQKKIRLKMEQNPQGFSATFDLVEKIMAAKNSVIDQLDKASTDVLAFTGDQPGGEGYVDVGRSVKLVPRHRWTPN